MLQIVGALACFSALLAIPVAYCLLKILGTGVTLLVTAKHDSVQDKESLGHQLLPSLEPPPAPAAAPEQVSETIELDPDLERIESVKKGLKNKTYTILKPSGGYKATPVLGLPAPVTQKS